MCKEVQGVKQELKEKHNFNKYERHDLICEELNKIYKNKNYDYGDSFGETYKKLGIISAITRITDKVNRLQSLATKEQKVKDESIKDTLKDLANYSIMTLIELED
ncbi:DUF1599 domain-containing protein [Clostridium botulinum]|nr:DUF1599 domain-containing protein [Clostridium botulinum]MBO0558950.1 DUF1599 domain-containing protein [Clostridium botulinum]